MQELIDRLRTLFDARETVPGLSPAAKERGIRDLLLAMEERMGTLRSYSGPTIPEDFVRLLERA